MSDADPIEIDGYPFDGFAFNEFFEEIVDIATQPLNVQSQPVSVGGHQGSSTQAAAANEHQRQPTISDHQQASSRLNQVSSTQPAGYDVRIPVETRRARRPRTRKPKQKTLPVIEEPDGSYSVEMGLPTASVQVKDKYTYIASTNTAPCVTFEDCKSLIDKTKWSIFKDNQDNQNKHIYCACRHGGSALTRAKPRMVDDVSKRRWFNRPGMDEHRCGRRLRVTFYSETKEVQFFLSTKGHNHDPSRVIFSSCLADLNGVWLDYICRVAREDLSLKTSQRLGYFSQRLGYFPSCVIAEAILRFDVRLYSLLPFFSYLHRFL
jgi:hypothetical protein